MVNLQYTDEGTFVTEDVEFGDEHYIFAKKLYEKYKYEADVPSTCTPLMVGSNKKSLMFGVNLGDRDKDRVAWERGDSLYRVIIEKIK